MFAKLCGENLEVIELNNDSGIQILSGQIIPKSDLTNDEITSLQSIFKKINNIEDINNILNDIEIENPENWKPSKFNIILEKIQKIPEKIQKKHIKILTKLKKRLNYDLSFLNHLQHENSIIIDAIEKGKWVFLDGIELAQPELFERISSLCDINNPRLNLYEKKDLHMNIQKHLKILNIKYIIILGYFFHIIHMMQKQIKN